MNDEEISLPYFFIVRRRSGKLAVFIRIQALKGSLYSVSDVDTKR
jgi:hypothetical protein